MGNKGLDTLFVHYGIRLEDMETIEKLCESHGVDSNWLKEYLLKIFHERKISNEDLDEKSLKNIIEKGLQKIK